ncbi:3-hydroxyacyl-CoA dehydrogenase [Archaeoglobus neptunius]|uniref:3-hydroxyacyl-CoA dehydrogenase n=1 Tax=Archaeoglobus neptunius TaxID=2798580 RepID=UPI001925952F|nr:3-hydroxyacyl-CoA dehydrogenase [Archaeoglobus neptunius]
MEKISVIGAGTMGAAIAALFANADYDVVLVDTSEEALEKARKRHMVECIEELERAGLRKREEIVSKIRYTTSIEKIGGSEFVIESVNERLDVKIRLFKNLENIVDCHLATNTSSFKPSEIALHLKNPERLTLFHFSNPPILMPLVEVGGELASEETIERAVELARSIGKRPVVLRKECRGHVLNRILGAAGAAAGYCLFYNTPEEIDAAIKNLGNPLGFFETIDLIGLDVVLDVLESFSEAYGRKFAGPKGMNFFLRKMLEWGKLGKKAGEGFYRWKNGKADIPPAEPGDIMPLIAAIVNEAFKIVEDGIADRETVNEVYKLATNSALGAFDIAEMIGRENILKTLDEAYRRIRLEVFNAAESMRD